MNKYNLIILISLISILVVYLSFWKVLRFYYFLKNYFYFKYVVFTGYRVKRFMGVWVFYHWGDMFFHSIDKKEVVKQMRFYRGCLLRRSAKDAKPCMEEDLIIFYNRWIDRYSFLIRKINKLLEIIFIP